jgi:hypothetical protein
LSSNTASTEQDVLAGADQRFVGALAEHEFEGADDDGLAGTGFPGDADQAGAEFPDEFVDQGEVADFEQGEHALSEALEAIHEAEPGEAWLTHLGHENDHATLQAELPRGVHVACDGLRIEL